MALLREKRAACVPPQPRTVSLRTTSRVACADRPTALSLSGPVPVRSLSGPGSAGDFSTREVGRTGTGQGPGWHPRIP